MQTEVGTKRTNYEWEGDNSAQKKTRVEGEEKLRLLVLGHYAGSLIGKGGENFQRLREKYNVKITGLSSRANERVLQLDGQRAECLKIVRELLPLCPLAKYKSYSTKCTLEVNILANTAAVGTIIGKGGSKLKEIAQETDTKVKVYPDILPHSNERVVALGGETEDAVVKGMETILVLLENAPKQTKTVFFHPDKLEEGEELPEYKVGKGSSNSSAALGFPDENNIGALLVAQRKLKEQKGFDPSIDFGSIQTTTVMTLSNELCGAIIGKAGQSIRHVKQVSGVQYEMSKADGDNRRTITLTGTQDQIQIAQQLMARSVRTSLFATGKQQQPQQQLQQPWPRNPPTQPYQQQMHYQQQNYPPMHHQQQNYPPMHQQQQNYPPMHQQQHSNYSNMGPWQPWD